VQNCKKKVAMVLPVFNDWTAFGLLLRDLDAQASTHHYSIHIFAVDDGSSDHKVPSDFQEHLVNIEDLHIVRLASNLGHQRAIAVGLVTVFQSDDFDAVVIMDSDGEDRALDAFNLLGLWEQKPSLIIVAKRAKRSESLLFRTFYLLYKASFRMLTGHSINFGNFCLLPKRALQSIVHNPAIWSNLPATVRRSRMKYVELPTPRGVRLCGTPRMNFVSLAILGISAISVYADVVLIRLAAMALATGAVALLGLATVVWIKVATNWAIPGWASYVAASLTIILIQTLIMAGLALFQLLSLRSLKPFIPLVDALEFVAEMMSMRGQLSRGDSNGRQRKRNTLSGNRTRAVQ
jgi:polyisoprenyl-phosphate glycosyltransferase